MSVRWFQFGDFRRTNGYRQTDRLAIGIRWSSSVSGIAGTKLPLMIEVPGILSEAMAASVGIPENGVLVWDILLSMCNPTTGY